MRERWIKDILTAPGLSGNLKLCLVAGDASTVANGSQTKWLDCSGDGYNFWRGSATTSQADDPAFTSRDGASLIGGNSH